MKKWKSFGIRHWGMKRILWGTPNRLRIAIWIIDRWTGRGQYKRKYDKLSKKKKSEKKRKSQSTYLLVKCVSIYARTISSLANRRHYKWHWQLSNYQPITFIHNKQNAYNDFKWKCVITPLKLITLSLKRKRTLKSFFTTAKISCWSTRCC